MATIDEILALLEKVWIYLPVTGAGGSPWSEKEKLDAQNELENLRKEIIEFQDNEKLFSSEIDQKLKTIEKSLDNHFKFLKKDTFKKDALKDQLSLIIKLLSSQTDVEDLERIEEEFQSQESI